MKTVKLAVIGCGGFGNYHLNHLLQMEDVEVIALVKRGERNLQKTALRLPAARLYHSVREMFGRETELDAALVCVTPACHDEIELLAAQKGVHLYIEKPLGISLEAVKRTEQAILDAKMITSVGYQERYNPELVFLRQKLEGAKVGMVSARWIGSLPGAAWWRKKEQSGGQMLEQTTHLFDLLRYLFGEMQPVSALGRSDLHSEIADCDVEDCSVVLVRFESGILATISSACYLDAERTDGEVGFEIYTDREIIRYHWGKFVEYQTEKQTVTKFFCENFHQRALTAFVEAVRSGDTRAIASDYSDGVKTLEATLKATELLSKPL